jgi:hypothetical protein
LVEFIEDGGRRIPPTVPEPPGLRGSAGVLAVEVLLAVEFDDPAAA